jgi:2-dehydro-3-deoxygluconokinase
MRVVAAGECMLELAPMAGGWRLSFAGDTFNTALSLCRLGIPVSYLTALGADPFSEEMRQSWSAEGLDLSLVMTDPERLPGLYAIKTDSAGERSFFYWRQQSAVRRLFTLDGIVAALHSVPGAALLYLSGITLSLFTAADQLRWQQLGCSVREQGGRVAFDPNFRPAGWTDFGAARAAITTFAPAVSVALPTFVDEQTLFGDDTPEATVRRWQEWGVEEVVVKLGAEGCLAALGGQREYVRATAGVAVTDSTGAGDAFNAAYLAARLRGGTPLEAGRAGNVLGAALVQYPGAILPRERMSDLSALMGLSG